MPVKIIQIGAGGTGNWFARALVHGLVSSVNPWPRHMSWVINDNDTIEPRNQLRQPFIGADCLGTHKATYVANYVRMVVEAKNSSMSNQLVLPVTDMFELVDTDRAIKDILTTSSYSGTMFNILVMAVDNTFTRNLFQKYIQACTLTQQRDTFMLDIGVSEDNAWKSILWRGDRVLVEKYDTISLPDGMMSCAERAEHAPVPQSTFTNGLAGLYGAQMVLELLRDLADNKQPPVGRAAFGSGFTSKEPYPSNEIETLWFELYKRNPEDQNLKTENGDF